MYVYQLSSSADHAEKTTKNKNCKATNISCETFFIAQTVEQVQSKKRIFFVHKQYFYQPVIHSNPYITLIDPPPNIEQV